MIKEITFNNLLTMMGAFALLALVTPLAASAADVEVNSTYPGVANVVEVVGDAAPGFPEGSIAGDGVGKTAFYFTPDQLFGKEITLGDIESMSYWTKKDTDHVVEPGDWYIQIYTKPYEGDVSPAVWYGDRVTAEPYFSVNLTDPVDTWNEWSTDGETNTLRFFDSALNDYFGGYSDPTWDTFVSGNTFSGDDYATREVLYITVQTGNPWAVGFEGQVDGLTIELTDETVGTVNFEAVAPFERSLEITKPAADYDEVAGVVDFEAIYVDEDGDDGVAWAVRDNTCAPDNSANVAGNVGGFSTPFSWIGGLFTSSIDMSALPAGDYCFIINPRDDSDEEDLRARRWFTLLPSPEEKNQCKKGGYEDFGFKNQGQCVRFVETGKDSR